MSLDSVHLSGSNADLDGLRDMLEAAIGPNEYVFAHVDVQIALLIIEAAKRAEDREGWFPRGKWATVQAIQSATKCELRKMFGAWKERR